MSSVLFLNVLDVSRAFGAEPTVATPQTIRDWLLIEYLRRRGGRFNYNPAIDATYDVFRGASSEHQAIIYCLTTGNPKGRSANVDAIKSVLPYALENVSRCYRIGFTAVAVGRIGAKTVYVGIKAPMVRVLGDGAFVVMPGYRMSYRPVETEIDLACSIALATFARDDFAKADFEYLYAGPGVSVGRGFRAIKGRDRKIFDRDTIDALLQIYVQGVALALEDGADAKEPLLRGYRIIDPREPPLPFVES